MILIFFFNDYYSFVFEVVYLKSLRFFIVIKFCVCFVLLSDEFLLC